MLKNRSWFYEESTRIDPDGARLHRATVAVELQKPKNYENDLSNLFDTRRGIERFVDQPIIMIAFGGERAECEFAADRGIMRAHVVIRSACAEVFETNSPLVPCVYPIRTRISISRYRGTDPPRCLQPGLHDALFLLARVSTCARNTRGAWKSWYFGEKKEVVGLSCRKYALFDLG